MEDICWNRGILKQGRAPNAGSRVFIVGETKAVSFFLGFLINKAIVRGRPAGFSDGNKSAINSHISQLRLLGYDARHSRARGAGFYK